MKPGILIDTGPLVALLDKNDSHHERTKRILKDLPSPFLTCEPVIAEACHLIAKVDPQNILKILLMGQRGFYEISFSLTTDYASLGDLVTKYKDHPVSLADLCLIRMAELHHEARILTFDSDFEFYRWGRNQRFQILD